jgi:hypothetical protein
VRQVVRDDTAAQVDTMLRLTWGLPLISFPLPIHILLYPYKEYKTKKRGEGRDTTAGTHACGPTHNDHVVYPALHHPYDVGTAQPIAEGWHGKGHNGS